MSFNTLLPVKELGEFVRLQTPDGDAMIMADAVEVVAAYDHGPRESGLNIAKLGAGFLDLPYLWGVIISRDAVDQHDQDSWHIGDLLFFAYEEEKGRLHHVGVYYGNGSMLHSPTSGKAIKIIKLAGAKHEAELCAVCQLVEIED
ncbi:NlpC/P60 family protein [Planococcus sp. ISL-110]|uniref:NlpC/P60 family protein n=1 Tax=Planococcus sp. ISL-110 TaxID=2819167 RepID=UPI003337BB4E